MADTQKYPLPKGVEDAELNRAQLAAAFGTSANTIDRWREDGMPVLQEGTNGQAYVFQLSECWAWKAERDDARKDASEKAERAVQQMRMELVGGSVGETDMALSNKERKEIYEVTVAYDRLAKERGDLIPRKEVVDLFNKVLGEIRSGIIGLPDILARDAGLTGKQAEQAVAATDELLAQLHRGLNDLLKAEADSALEAAE